MKKNNNKTGGDAESPQYSETPEMVKAALERERAIMPEGQQYTAEKEFEKKKVKPNQLSEAATSKLEYEKLSKEYQLLNKQYNRLLLETNTQRKHLMGIEERQKRMNNDIARLENGLSRMHQMIQMMLKEDERG